MWNVMSENKNESFGWLKMHSSSFSFSSKRERSSELASKLINLMERNGFKQLDRRWNIVLYNGIAYMLLTIGKDRNEHDTTYACSENAWRELKNDKEYSNAYVVFLKEYENNKFSADIRNIAYIRKTANINHTEKVTHISYKSSDVTEFEIDNIKDVIDKFCKFLIENSSKTNEVNVNV